VTTDSPERGEGNGPDSDRPTESDWDIYRRLAPAAVPRRAEQLAVLICLLPGDARRVVELGCGEGHLSAALLDCFPSASVLALDGSEEMRQRAAQRLTVFEDRASVAAFELGQSDWLGLVDGADAVVSSLALHHLDGRGKERLFAELARRLVPNGTLLVADLVQPQRAEALALFAESWDGNARRQSLEVSGGSDLFDLFVSSEWNYYRWPDPVDRPSPLYQQLRMMDRAGFAVVDCFWMDSGHAIYGGYKTTEAGVAPVKFARALDSVTATLS
jgi:tRNA (cmo5U34)-methyltransferase